MAVPKSKQSKSRTNKRFANYKATAATLAECPQCHELKEAHKVCKNCGYYKGVEVVAQKEEAQN
ncbi:MAG: 50S ribosomal protein L32 [Clostridiales bacterium]|jgi:large subunit ribosomal protein L32|nr:50S ribosomal protein L32 [Clostridiales bacterium]